MSLVNFSQEANVHCVFSEVVPKILQYYLDELQLKRKFRSLRISLLESRCTVLQTAQSVGTGIGNTMWFVDGGS
jgi:hypothetical protein